MSTPKKDSAKAPAKAKPAAKPAAKKAPAAKEKAVKPAKAEEKVAPAAKKATKPAPKAEKKPAVKPVEPAVEMEAPQEEPAPKGPDMFEVMMGLAPAPEEAPVRDFTLWRTVPISKQEICRVLKATALINLPLTLTVGTVLPQ